MSTDIQNIRHLQQENIRLRSENTSLKKYVERLQRGLRAMVGMQRELCQVDAETNVFKLVYQVLQYAMDAVDSENGALALLDEQTGDLVFVAVIGGQREKLLNLRMQRDQGTSHWAVKKREIILIEDALREPVVSPLATTLKKEPQLSLICLPIYDGKRPLGVIELVNTQSGRPFNQGDKDILLVVSQLAAMAIVAAEEV